MKKLNRAVDRFAYSHPNFGIPNLMRYVVIGNVIRVRSRQLPDL